MIRLIVLSMVAFTLLVLPTIGCDRKVSEDTTVKKNTDGTTSKDSTTVTKNADGTTTKTEEHKKDETPKP